jgi:hypothetical protein
MRFEIKAAGFSARHVSEEEYKVTSIEEDNGN